MDLANKIGIPFAASMLSSISSPFAVDTTSCVFSYEGFFLANLMYRVVLS